MDIRATKFAVSEAKARFSELLARAEAGEEIEIRRHGKVVARLVPPGPAKPTIEERRKAAEDFLRWRKEHGPRLAPGETVVDLVRAGRKY